MVQLCAAFLVSNGTQTELAYTPREVLASLERIRDGRWCDAIEIKIPKLKLSLLSEDWRANLN